VPITGTSPEAQDIQLKIQQAMSGEQRMFLAFEMSEFARDLLRQNKTAAATQPNIHAPSRNP
jgi:hypothetical protein